MTGAVVVSSAAARGRVERGESGGLGEMEVVKDESFRVSEESLMRFEED